MAFGPARELKEGEPEAPEQRARGLGGGRLAEGYPEQGVERGEPPPAPGEEVEEGLLGPEGVARRLVALRGEEARVRDDPQAEEGVGAPAPLAAEAEDPYPASLPAELRAPRVIGVDAEAVLAAAARALGGVELFEGAVGEIVVLALEVPFGVENLLRGD